MATLVIHPQELPPDPEAGTRRFGLALLGGVLAEALLIGGLVWYTESLPTHPRPLPKKQVMAVQMVTLPPPPKPIPPKPVVKPTPPKPIPPKPVIHHSPPPPPAPHPKMVVPPKPTPPAPPVKVATPPKPVPVPKPVTPPAPPPPPVMSAAERADLMGKYVATLRPIIQRQLHVPAELRAMGVSGSATVEFEVSPAGKILWAKVVTPSPLGAVNRAALAAIQSGNFPPFLKKMPKHNTVFEIPIEVGANSNS